MKTETKLIIRLLSKSVLIQICLWLYEKVIFVIKYISNVAECWSTVLTKLEYF